MSLEDGWLGDETRERLWFDEQQELLKADADSYHRWLEELDRELKERIDG